MALNRNIAYIDLNRKKVKIAPIPLEWRRVFLGGRGMGAYLFSKFISDECDPFGPDNVMVISGGLLGGTLAAPFSCAFIIAQSPLTNLLSTGQIQGQFASELRWAGFDHLVIMGRAKKPVYLYVRKGMVEIRDANKIWGKNISKAQALIRMDLKNEDVRMLCIGPAGEKLVRFATILSDQNTISGRTGLGAVFGSKNIKAIVCHGTMDLEVKHPGQILKYKRKINGHVVKDNIVKTDQFELNLTIRDITGSGFTDFHRDSFSENNLLTQELGIDPLTVREILHWIFSLLEKGIIKSKETVGLKFNREDRDAVSKLIHSIANRKGFGDVLAKGPFRAAELIGYSSLKYFVPVKFLIRLHSEDPPFVNSGRDEPKEMILNCLGINVDKSSDYFASGSDFRAFIEQIRFNTGLIFDENELKEIAYRCYAIERLFNIRKEEICRNNFKQDYSFDVPSGLEMTGAIWNSIDLKIYKRKVREYYKKRKLDKRNLLKADILKKLKIADLWSQEKDKEHTP